VATITFVLLRQAPGGPFDGEKKLPPEIEKNIRAKYHLDESPGRQYLRYLGQVARGDLGISFKYPDRTVAQIIAEGAPASAAIGGLAFLVALALGLPWGILSALKRRLAWDGAGLAYATLALALPSLVLGPLMAQFFGLTLGWLPVAGFGDPAQLILPSLTLGLLLAAPVLRLTRAGMLEVLSQDFVRAARSRGVRGLRLITRHTLRGGLLPLVQFLGPAAAGILTGTLVIEQIFWIPGLGKAFVQSVVNRDYTLVLGTTLFYAAALQVANLFVDLVTAWMDPRIRGDQGR
jgi:oligopeptide transport system permease protein